MREIMDNDPRLLSIAAGIFWEQGEAWQREHLGVAAGAAKSVEGGQLAAVDSSSTQAAPIVAVDQRAQGVTNGAAATGAMGGVKDTLQDAAGAKRAHCVGGAESVRGEPFEAFGIQDHGREPTLRAGKLESPSNGHRSGPNQEEEA